MWKNNLANAASKFLAVSNVLDRHHNAERDYKGQVDENAKRAVHSFLFGTAGDDDDAGPPPKSALMEFCVEDMDKYGGGAGVWQY